MLESTRSVPQAHLLVLMRIVGFTSLTTPPKMRQKEAVLQALPTFSLNNRLSAWSTNDSQRHIDCCYCVLR